MKNHLVFLCALLPLSYVTAEKPNIILIMADDMGYSDIGCYGGEINTPNLDRLAENGQRYSQFYNCAKCTTTRSSLLTGRYVTPGSLSQNTESGPTLGSVLKSAGYRTLWSGKNHSSIRPPEYGFDRFYGFQGGACSFWNPGSELHGGGSFPHITHYEWMVDDQWIPDFIPEDDYYMTDEITDYAIDWLEEYQSENKPYFLYLAYNAPHWPLHAKPDDIAKYKGMYDEGYQRIRQARYKRMTERGYLDPKISPLHPQEITDWNTLTEEEKAKEAKRMEIHAAMVDCLDQNIGRVIDKVRVQGELDNTLILFLIDNGSSPERPKRHHPHYIPDGSEEPGSIMTYDAIGKQWALVTNAPLYKHKASSHEGGVRTPMIAHWPTEIKKTGGWYHDSAHLVDYMATVLDMTGQSAPTSFKDKAIKAPDGVSLLPSFKKKPMPERSIPIANYWGGGQMIRQDKWKLVRPSKGDWELYDMSQDNTETNNIAASHPELVESLEGKFKEWEAHCNQSFNIKSKNKNK